MKAAKKTWNEVYEELCKIGLDQKSMPSENQTFHKYLANLGWEKQKMPKEETACFKLVEGDRVLSKSYKRLTVREFADNNPKGTFIISIANHLTVLVDGTLYDTWNCGHKSVGNYWVK
jgi:hypothetical protein